MIINEIYPNKNESKKDFIARFMSATKDEYPDVKQRFAICMSYWNNRRKNKIKEGITNMSYNHLLYVLNNVLNWDRGWNINRNSVESVSRACEKYDDNYNWEEYAELIRKYGLNKLKQAIDESLAESLLQEKVDWLRCPGCGSMNTYRLKNIKTLEPFKDFDAIDDESNEYNLTFERGTKESDISRYVCNDCGLEFTKTDVDIKYSKTKDEEDKIENTVEKEVLDFDIEDWPEPEVND